jgi:cytochrome c2
MPASVKFTALLLACGVVAALASGIVQHRQTAAQTRHVSEAMTGGHVEAGKAAIERQACGSCHIIPGIPTATGRAGPSLRGVGRRAVIGGKLSNDPANMTLWIAHPQRVSPGTGMPDLPMAEQEARDISAFLYSER